MTFKLCSLFAMVCFMEACDTDQTAKPVNASGPQKFIIPVDSKISIPIDEYNNTKGYWENGQLITEFDCPDSKDFPPVDIKLWDKVPVVNGRFPTYEETKNGISIHHYGEKANPNIKPYNMTLPKLASCYNYVTKSNDKLVIVIQIVQTSKDTVVGFRYLSGGCGGATFSHFYFLTDEEIRKVIQ